MSTPTQRATPIDPILNAVVVDYSYPRPRSTPKLGENDAENNANVQQPPAFESLGDSSVDSSLRPSEADTENPDEEESWIRNLGWRRGMILLTLCCARIFGAALSSLLAPFFPFQAKIKGASPTEIGLIFGCFQLVVFVASPIFGNFITQIGPKFMFVSGNIVLSTCGVLFGILYWCPDHLFVVMCFLSRFIESLAGSAQGTANLAIASHTFPTRVSSVMGLLEAGSCIGLTFGPVIGGLLYSVDGYYLPFAVMGGLSILVGFAAIFLLPSSASMDKPAGPHDSPSEQQEVDVKVSKLVLLKMPIILLTGFMVFMGQAAIGFMDVALSLHVKDDIGLQSNVLLGLIFLIPAGIVVILAPIYGYIADRFKSAGRPLMICGCLVGGLSLVCMGPCPVLPWIQQYKDTLWLLIVTLAISGIGWASLVVSYQEFVFAAKKKHLPDNMETKGMVSGIFNAFNSLGAFVGPTAGGPLLAGLGFPWATTIIAGGLILSGVLLLVYSLCECAFMRDERDQGEMSHPSEREPLLDDVDSS